MTAATAARTRRATFALAGLLAAALALLGWQTLRPSAARSELSQRATRANTLACDADRIRELTRAAPAAAVDLSSPRGELSAHVQAAMQAAKLDPATLLSILPQPPRRLPKSQIVEHSWQLVLDAVPLAGVVEMIRSLRERVPALRVGTLHLRPRADGAGWGVDVVVGKPSPAGGD